MVLPRLTESVFGSSALDSTCRTFKFGFVAHKIKPQRHFGQCQAKITVYGGHKPTID